MREQHIFEQVFRATNVIGVNAKLIGYAVGKVGLCLLLCSVLMGLNGCTTVPIGQTKVDLIDELVNQQEFSRIEKLLLNIDPRERDYEALVIRRRAIRPLIAQFETNVIREAQLLEAADEWPEAEALLQDALNKLPESQILLKAESAFYEKRTARLEKINQDITLIEGSFLSELSPQFARAVDVHPQGVLTRWQEFWHKRKASKLAVQLTECGQKELSAERFDLAEACFIMVKTLGSIEPVDQYLVAINEHRIATELQYAAKEKERAVKRASTDREQLARLKVRYRQLIDARWWAAARDTLAEMQIYGPGDKQVMEWVIELQVIIDGQVASRIRQGQLLYSQGELVQALSAWQGAAELDPANPTVLSHIARVERFLDKLARLNQPTS